MYQSQMEGGKEDKEQYILLPIANFASQISRKKRAEGEEIFIISNFEGGEVGKIQNMRQISKKVEGRRGRNIKGREKRYGICDFEGRGENSVINRNISEVKK